MIRYFKVWYEVDRFSLIFPLVIVVVGYTAISAFSEVQSGVVVLILIAWLALYWALALAGDHVYQRIQEYVIWQKKRPERVARAQKKRQYAYPEDITQKGDYFDHALQSTPSYSLYCLKLDALFELDVREESTDLSDQSARDDLVHSIHGLAQAMQNELPQSEGLLRWVRKG